PLVLKQLDFLNAWQGKKPYLLWFSMFLTDQPLRALNRLSQKKLDHRVKEIGHSKGGSMTAFQTTAMKRRRIGNSSPGFGIPERRAAIL
ncbi:MAG TPA: hypothetical protein VJ936_08510, partial [Desulfobacteraceae bacterium]|nr:hypothetical protein [Desulfobacteraceae bacterium]